MSGINQWVERIHKNAKVHGWHDKPRSALETHMLIVGEAAEAMEEVRSGNPDAYYNKGKEKITIFEKDQIPNTAKIEGEAVELVDAVIRIFDYFGEKGWDFEKLLTWKHAYNQTRSYRHGGKAY